MRLTKAQAALNRQHIIDAASRLFCEHGFDGAGLADLMKAAGFTHGGFYNHFRSKDVLAAAATAAALDRSTSSMAKTLECEAGGGDPLMHYIETYLSLRHRDDRGGGCPVASLAADVARQGKMVGTAFAEGVATSLETLAAHLDGIPPDKETAPAHARERAVLMLSALAGSLILARAVAGSDPSLSAEILASTRRQLCQPRARLKPKPATVSGKRVSAKPKRRTFRPREN